MRHFGTAAAALALGAALTLAAASVQAQQTAPETGTPAEAGSVWEMTEAERTAFAAAVGACWSVEPDYRMVTVTVRLGMDRRGRVIGNYIELVLARGGDDAAQAAAYEAVRNAILQCEGRGYDLPQEKYEVWREVDLTFNGRDGGPSE